MEYTLKCFVAFVEYQICSCCRPSLSYLFSSEFITPYREKNKSYYYHQKFKRVTPYEDCEEDDGLCLFEATEQYNRDR